MLTPTAALQALPSTDDTETTLQVHGDSGVWHRRTHDVSRTACGDPLYRLGQTLRPDSYLGPLCRICFTPYELAISAELERVERTKVHGGDE